MNISYRPGRALFCIGTILWVSITGCDLITGITEPGQGENENGNYGAGCAFLLNDSAYDACGTNGWFSYSMHDPSTTEEMNDLMNIPYRTSIVSRNDTFIYSFRLANKGCIKYFGKLFQRSDTLVLSFDYCGSPCGEACEYFLEYRIPSSEYMFSSVVLRSEHR